MLKTMMLMTMRRERARRRPEVPPHIRCAPSLRENASHDDDDDDLCSDNYDDKRMMMTIIKTVLMMKNNVWSISGGQTKHVRQVSLMKLYTVEQPCKGAAKYFLSQICVKQS